MSQNVPARLHLRIVTPNSLLVDEDVDEVAIPGLDGYLGILPGHRALNAALGEGTITYRKGGRSEDISVQGGYAEVQSERVLVIAEKSEGGGDQPEEG